MQGGLILDRFNGPARSFVNWDLPPAMSPGLGGWTLCQKGYGSGRLQLQRGDFSWRMAVPKTVCSVMKCARLL